MAKKALITGITGQDGSYLSEYLLDLGYEVHGIVRRVAIENTEHRLGRIRHLLERLHLHAASLESYPALFQVMSSVQPDEVYHLAAQSFVGDQFEDEFSTLTANINGTHYMLAAVRQIVPDCRFYFAGSSEMFGNSPIHPQNEETPFRPRSAYGISKLAAYHLTRNYRETYGLHASCGILYNHESPRRGFEFVTRKITSQAVKIKLGLEQQISLGNLEARRDWGHAREYVKAMIASGQTHSVREFLETAFRLLDLDPYRYLRIDENLIRPSDVNLVGDSTKAKKHFQWLYKLSFEDLVKEMVTSDLEMYSRRLELSSSL
jgi:GDPmannose 4,6-dehydratase